MLKNFQIGVIISTNSTGGRGIIVLDLGEEFCKNISNDWSNQYRKFTEGKSEKIYNRDSQGEKFTYQYFAIKPYELPEFMSVINSGIVNTKNISNIPRNHGVDRKKVVCFFGVAIDDKTGCEIILFQNMSAKKFIAPWRCLSEVVLHPIQEMSRRKLYTEDTKNKGYLALDDKLTAIYNSNTQELRFNNYLITNKTLPILDYRIKEILNKEIKKLLKHRIFKCENINLIATNPNIEVRMCFAKLRDDNILDEIILELLVEDAEDNNVDIVIEGNQIVVPTNDEELIDLIMLINGDLTERKFTRQTQRFRITSKKQR